MNPAMRIQEGIPQVAEAINHMHIHTQNTIVSCTQSLRDDISKIEPSIKEVQDVISSRLQTVITKAFQQLHFNFSISPSPVSIPNLNSVPGIHHPPASLSSHQSLSNSMSSSSLIRPDVPVAGTRTEQLQSNPPIPNYKMSRCITTVYDLWKEWTIGIGGQPSVQILEQQYGDRWRGGSKSTETKFFKGRKLIVDRIESIRARDRSTIESAVMVVEEQRLELQSLNKLVTFLRNEKRTRD